MNTKFDVTKLNLQIFFFALLKISNPIFQHSVCKYQEDAAGRNSLEQPAAMMKLIRVTDVKILRRILSAL